ncbi:MAG: TetR family transcriptional regulator C-terminal domain-containing protein, partial [Panacagrimonas sp.]
VEALTRPNAGRAEIELTFRRMVAHACSAEGQRGCLINNCTTEIAPLEPEILEAVRTLRGELEAAFAKAIARSQQERTITSREKPRALARYLVNTLSGINVAARSRPSKAMLDDVVRIALRALD